VLRRKVERPAGHHQVYYRICGLIKLRALSRAALTRNNGCWSGCLPGGQVADLPRDGHCVVGEAFVVAADQGGVHRWFHAVRPVLGEQDGEQVTVQCVDLVVRTGLTAGGTCWRR